MTQKETNKRNEAIALMLNYNRPRFNFNEDWSLLMPAYEHIQKLGYKCIIEPSKMYTNQIRVEVSQPWFTGLFINNSHQDLRTAIWLTVSDFAIEFNKNGNGK